MAVRADDVDLIRDRSLVELCQAGDQQAFGDLYERYYARLLRFCTRRVGNVHEAEEITQEAFARAFTAIPRFAGERRFYPWLTVIASRLCIDSHRRVARTEPAAEIDLGGVEGGQQQVVDNVDIAYLAEAMHRLGPRHREVLTLRESHGWTYQQIAEHYDVTMGTVEALLFRARKALRREFLALAGDEGRFATLPVLGLLVRGGLALRSRVAGLSQALPVAAASVASVAAVASGVALTAPAHSALPVVDNHAITHVVATVSTPVAPIVSRLTTSASALVSSPPSAASAPSLVGLQTGTAAQGRATASGDPSELHVGPFTLATNLADVTSLLRGQ